MPEVLKKVWIQFFFVLPIFLFSCSGQGRGSSEVDFYGVDSFAAMLEYDLIQLENEMEELGVFTEKLLEAREEIIRNGDRRRYRFDGVGANSEPGADPGRSTLYVSRLAEQPEAVEDLLLTTNPLDSVFISITRSNPVVSQIYFNSAIQLSRLYPPYNVNAMLEPDLDITSFNFYYEADAYHNPERKPVWVDDIYVDPVGRGWITTLIRPVYLGDELLLVLGMDVALNTIIESYLDKDDRQMMIVDKDGMLVAGRTKAIESFSLPPLKNHAYPQTITSDSFRKEDFNLFKSRSPEVRRVASEILREDAREAWMMLGKQKTKIVSKEMERLGWYVLEIFM